MHQVAAKLLCTDPAPSGLLQQVLGVVLSVPPTFCWIDVLDQVISISLWCACVRYCGLAVGGRLPLLGPVDAGDFACRVSNHLSVSQSATSTAMA